MERESEIENCVASAASSDRGGPGTNASATDPDAALVERVVRSDGRDYAAFAALVARHRSHVVTSCSGITGSAAEAEDLTQEIFIKVFRKLPQFEGRSSFKTWLNRVKVNQCLDHISRNNKIRQIHDAERDVEELASPAPRHGCDLARRQNIRDAFDAIGETLRTPLILRERDGLSYREIAEELDLGVSAVKMRVKRGRERFRTVYASGPGCMVPGDSLQA